MTSRPSPVIDPVCGMAVDVATAEANGLIAEHDGRTYAFCRNGCQQAFLEDAAVYAVKASAAGAVAPAMAVASSGAGMLPLIDEGMRHWYESCPCCLGDAYPEIKAQLDAERAAAAQPPVDPGICEVAEARG